MASGDPIFEVKKTSGSIEFVFSSTFAHIDQVCEQTRLFLGSCQMDIEKEMFAIDLVMREGLTNAVRHGNKGDPEKKVQFAASIEPPSDNRPLRIRLVIEDEGGGFDWRTQQSVAVRDDEDHGRGFAIMKAYFSRYSYNDSGNILYLEKDIPPS